MAELQTPTPGGTGVPSDEALKSTGEKGRRVKGVVCGGDELFNGPPLSRRYIGWNVRTAGGAQASGDPAKPTERLLKASPGDTVEEDDWLMKSMNSRN